ncbi:MAG: DUF998 domain-containing protein [Pseudomonadota bacterium]
MQEKGPSGDTISEWTPSGALLSFCAVAGFVGIVAMIAGNAVASVIVPGHDWVADTISALAVGKYELLQDISLYAFAAGWLGAALGTAHYHIDGRRWTLGVIGLALIALCVVIIAARNEYGDGDNEGVEVHIYIVYVLAALFFGVTLAMAKGFRAHARWLSHFSIGTAVAWLVAAPIFLMLPTGYDGAWERVLLLITVAWLGSVSLMLWQAARRLG